MERNIERLPPSMRAEIKSVETRLTRNLKPDSQPVLEDFFLNGQKHKAYYVPRGDCGGKARFEFECLIY